MSFIAGAGVTNADLLYTGVKHLPKKGEEVYSEGFELQLGGGIPATLINLARLGIKTKLATELGCDIFSDFAKHEFNKSNTEYLNLYGFSGGAGFPLNVTSAAILPDDRSFLTYGRNALEPTDENKEQFYKLASGSKITIMQAGGFTDVYKKLKSEGTILVFDTGWDDGMSLDTYKEYLELADYYTPNRKEAMKITNTSTPEAAAEVLKKYFKRVIVKLDRGGVMGLDESGAFTVGAIDSFRHVDSTGAGDAFLAGFCYGLFYDYSFKDCLLLGNITGGKAVTAAGALSAYCDSYELIEHFNNAK